MATVDKYNMDREILLVVHVPGLRTCNGLTSILFPDVLFPDTLFPLNPAEDTLFPDY